VIHRASGEKGFTLIEILVAVTILAIAVSSIFRVFGGSLRTVVDAENYAHASVLAESKMNELLGLDTELKTGRDRGNFPENRGYNWEWEIEKYLAESDDRRDEELSVNELGRIVTYKIAVSVTWNEGARERSVDLTTLKTVLEAE